jgi:hypothetical protein
LEVDPRTLAYALWSIWSRTAAIADVLESVLQDVILAGGGHAARQSELLGVRCRNVD